MESAILSSLYRVWRTRTVGEASLSAADIVLSQTVFVMVRLYTEASEPSSDVAASRFGRNRTPSGVSIVSGTDTSTQARAPWRSRPADVIPRESSESANR